MRKPVGNSDDNSGGEEVSAIQQTSSLGHSRASQVPTKLIQKGLDFGWEQSANGSLGILPRRLSRLCGASVVTARDAAAHRMEDPDNVIEKTVTE
jgi:hypothetical protein